MSKIEYEIALNESGRPCIELGTDYKETAADKFFCIEITRYLLQGMYSRRRDDLDQNTVEQLLNSINFLGQISDETAALIWKGMREVGDIAFLTNNNYHIIVETLEDLNKLDQNLILFGEKIFKRKEGLKVLVTKEMQIYELVGGIENQNWSKL
jgi:hypothetical protein